MIDRRNQTIRGHDVTFREPETENRGNTNMFRCRRLFLDDHIFWERCQTLQPTYISVVISRILSSNSRDYCFFVCAVRFPTSACTWRIYSPHAHTPFAGVFTDGRIEREESRPLHCALWREELREEQENRSCIYSHSVCGCLYGWKN